MSISPERLAAIEEQWATATNVSLSTRPKMERDPTALREALDDLNSLLARRNGQDEYIARVKRLLAQEFQEFVVFVVEVCPALDAVKHRCFAKPSDFLTRLIMATRTFDTDELSRIEHEIRSLSDVATAG